jgi:uncharacterized protein YndB with AHSA1/START domain
MPIVIGMSVLLVALALAVATRPSTFRIVRTAVINAPAEAVFAALNDLRRFSEWSPYEKLDPHMQKRFEGADRGVGAVYGWSGNSKAGAGDMTITVSEPNRRVVIALRFERPFKSSSTTEFTLEPSAEGVHVTWAMFGENTLFAKVFSLVANMDKLLGKDFEEGLSNLKAVAEGRAGSARQLSRAATSN